MLLALVSDTHLPRRGRVLPPACVAVMRSADLIVHAGDFTTEEVLSEMSALQTRPATQVAPIVFVVQVSVPVALAPFLGGESWAHTPLGGMALVFFLLTVAAGAGLIGTTRAVSGLVAAAEAP